MNVVLPGSPIYDVASTTTTFLSGVAAPAELAAGVFLGFLIIQFIVDQLFSRTMTEPPRQGPPMM